jgi:hypothetical protein
MVNTAMIILVPKIVQEVNLSATSITRSTNPEGSPCTILLVEVNIARYTESPLPEQLYSYKKKTPWF